MKAFYTTLFLIGAFTLFGNNIQVSGVSFEPATNELSFTIEFDNSWTDFQSEPDTYDAAWVWVKYAPNGSDNWHHAEIIDSVAVTGYFQYISYDDLGIMVLKSTSGPGTFGPQEFTVELAPLVGSYQDFKVFATEMVFIDNGDYYAGDAYSDGRFYQNGDDEEPLFINSEDGILRGEQSGEFNQVGSASNSNILADFPKGHQSFFCMKYKISTKQYLDFLNCLQRIQQSNRVQSDLTGPTVINRYVMTGTTSVINRNPIKVDENIGTGPIQFYLDLDEDDVPNETNDGAHLALNHLSPEDVFAYLDWCGLRPMTELEYEKICRGNEVTPIANEYAWGTDTYNDAGSLTNNGENNESTSEVGNSTSLFKSIPLRCGYAATPTSTRLDAGATFWGVQDIHNLGEIVIGVNSTNFTRESYGDGNVTVLGNVDVDDWTIGVELLSTHNSSEPSPISKGKLEITASTRSEYMGARGVKKLYLQ